MPPRSSALSPLRARRRRVGRLAAALALAFGALSACDADADGVRRRLDCDDRNADRSPELSETCDGIDNDCDGIVDEGVQLTFYRDQDGDGAGGATYTTAACEVPVGYADNAIDCDDTDPDRAPGIAERCDGVDNDCDGVVDLDMPSSAFFYYDRDGDGAGDLRLGPVGCEPAAGTVQNSDDCDDANDAVYPEAPELCDYLDNDCDFQTDEDCR